MKRLVVVLCALTLSQAQYQSQFGGFGTSGYAPASSDFSSFGSNRNFEPFSTNALNNNFFGQSSSASNSFGGYSGFPFSSSQPSSINLNYQQPSSGNQNQFSFPSTSQQGFQPSLFNSFSQPSQPSYQPNAFNQYQNQVSHAAPSTYQPAQQTYQQPPPPPQYQPPQQTYQPPQQTYQQPAPAYQAPQQSYQQPPPPAYEPPQQSYQPTQARSAPYINTAQLSYNAAAPVQSAPQSSPPLSTTGPTTPKPSILYPPAPVHYVSIGQKLEGDYKFGYETGKGSNGDQSFRSETRDPDGTVRGSYGYVDSNGKPVTVHYEAGREGFKILSEDEAKNGNRATPQQQPQLQPPAPAPPAQPTPQAPAPQPSEPAAASVNQEQTGQRRRYETPQSPSANLGVTSETSTFGPPVYDLKLLSYNIGSSG